MCLHLNPCEEEEDQRKDFNEIQIKKLQLIQRLWEFAHENAGSNTSPKGVRLPADYFDGQASSSDESSQLKALELANQKLLE